MITTRMLNNFKPSSATDAGIADEQNAFKNNNNSRLHFKGKSVFSWTKSSSNSDNTKSSKPNIILSRDKLNNNNTSNNKENSNQPELRGVQNLKHLWNSRIGAILDTKSAACKVLSPAKSYGCLLQEDKPQSDVARALSLHNCSEIKESISSQRFVKDNFYKYKTAATTDQNRNNSISPTSTPTRGNIHSRLSFNFPMIGSTPRGEKIHWMRREDIVFRRKHSTDIFSSPEAETDTKMNLITSPPKVEATPDTPQSPSTISLPQTLIICDNNSNDFSSPISDARDAISSHCSSNSLRSIESTTSRKKNGNSNRKYSFKTQVKSYHSPRKMPYYAGNPTNNKVAKLTQQFNEIIQKDKKILDEVKRNNGILISRGGHIYKVIENSEQRMSTVPSATASPISKDTTSRNNSTVQRAIKNFESKTSEKPKVPIKSVQVMRKKKDLASRKDTKCDLKPVVLEGIKEEPKISSEEWNKVKSVISKHSKIESNLKVEKKTEIQTKIETQSNKNDNNTVPLEVSQKDASHCEENGSSPELGKSKYARIYEKLRFRGVFRKNEEADPKAQPEVLKALRTEMKLKLKTSKLSEEVVNSDSSYDQSQTKPVVSTLDGSNNSSEAKILKLDANTVELAEEAVEIATDSQTNVLNQPKIQSLQENCFKDDFRPAVHKYVDAGEQDEESSEHIAEVKILNAIEEVNQKIKSLASKSHDQFGFKLPPNESFLYQANSKDSDKEKTLIEAVNTSLVNYTESKMTEDDLTFKNIATVQPSTEPQNIEPPIDTSEENTYEFIAIDPKHVASSESPLQPQKSFLFCNSNKNCGSIETFKNSQQGLLDSYESCENYESINELSATKSSADDGYEICESPDPPPPPRPQKEPTELQRNTTDKLPELPKPKRIIQKKLFTAILATDISSRVSESGSVNDEENIYDTIKGSNHCYESLQSSKEKCADTISLTSNGYESINHYRRQLPLCNAESSSTISSDHKTNSLYEMSMVNGMFSGCHNYSRSYITSSENSDDWVDISDSEANSYDQIGKQQFIVVRERMKCHRSPDWSKRVRGQRLHQTISDDDDVDHYYEPLFPVGNKSFRNEIGKTSTPETPKRTHHGNKSLQLTEDYDSFDTDDDVYEDDESMKKNDSGVDICNVKLPNPPPSRNQVYAFVKKFKNFISNKKSPSDPNKNLADSLQAKMYENTQFQVEGNEYQSTLKPTRRAPDKPKTPKVKEKKIIDRTVIKDNSKDNNIYENTDFHNPKLKTTSQVNSDNLVQLSTSEKNLIAANDVPSRSKSKTGKSFKSRLKSFGTTGFDSKQFSTLTTARSTFYVSDTNANEQDSGIFEKTSSGDLVANKPEVPQIANKTVAPVRKNKKELNTSNAYRRRTTIGIRPNDPPPPPPIVSDDSKKPKQRPSTTSWYAECGVFKIDNNMSIEDGNPEKQTSNLNKSTSSTSWYAEAGLYQTSGISVASSSGSSGVSTGNEGGTGDDIEHHVFLNEPLYQIYNAEKLESISRDMEDHGSTDGYEEIGVHEHTSGSEGAKPTRPTALQLVGPKTGPSRTLWSEISEVITSEILLTLTPRERSLQEAKFEIITSEASYLKSLNLLRSHFMNHHAFHDTTILSSRDRKTLFSYIAPVHECSEKLLCELENCWQDNIMLLGLSKSIYACAEKNFHVYVSYCEHQGKMDRTLRKLKEAKSVFCQKLDILESDPLCCGLTLHSFLMLPMQRITRLPLLIDAVFSKVHPSDDEYENWKLTLAILNKIVAQCNEAANRCEQAYEIERISRQLEFPSHIRALAIAPVGVAATGTKPRFLVKKGELTHLIWRGDDAKLTFGKKFTKSNIYAFLFSDLMVLTKRKSEELFTVLDYCPRNMLTISSGDAVPQLPTKDANQTGKNLILMTLLENYERKTVELVLSCPSVSELERWLQATRPPEAENPGEKLYEQWDCPQVIAKHEYVANEPDLLSLEVGDVVNVSRKLPDGWFNGERIRDGAVGWFPGSFTEEVNSVHVRARNLKQRYRLLTFTATYLEMQKRK